MGEDLMKRSDIVAAITAADAAGVASGFEQAVKQVADNLVNQGIAWRHAANETAAKIRWWMYLLPWKAWRIRREALDLVAAVSAVEALAKQLNESVGGVHAKTTAERKEVAAKCAAVVLAPDGLVTRLLGGARSRVTASK